MNMRAEGQLGRWSACALLCALCSAGCDRPAVPGEARLPATGDAVAAEPAAESQAPPSSVDSANGRAVHLAAHTSSAPTPDSFADPNVPGWVADAVFYQIFPERFANGDKSNDPTRESLEFSDSVPQNWAITPWAGDWYARADWEQALGGSFFENGVFHRRYGGDLQGILDRLDYLAELGINAIYLNPVFYARSLHKYDGNTFHHVDPYFGPDPNGDLALMAEETSDPATWHWTAADKLFLKLIDAAHQRGMRLIIDGVFNHTGRDFFAFADLRDKQASSRYRDWYIVQSLDNPDTPQNEFRYKGWWGVDTLPEFANDVSGNDLHPGPKQYVFDSTARWMDPNGDSDPADGIDGWRLDVANEVPTGFWRDWHEHVRAINPQAYTVAEIWDDAAKFIADGGFSATMNYHGFAFPVKGFLIDGVLSAGGAAKQLDERRNGFPPAVQFAVQNLLDSHDTDRLASMIVNAGRRPFSQPHRFDYDIGVSPRYVADYDVSKPMDKHRAIQRLAALMQMTYVGAPMIYYGTEAGMWGADDPCDRMPMVWPELNYDDQRHHPLGRPRQSDKVAFDRDLFNYYRAAIALRRRMPALRRGSVEFIQADGRANFLGFARIGAEETLLVGLNRGDEEYRWEIPVGQQQLLTQEFTASGHVDLVRIEETADGGVVTVPACDGVVLQLTGPR